MCRVRRCTPGWPDRRQYKLYDAAKKISPADIYQSFVYAYSVGAQSDPPSRTDIPLDDFDIWPCPLIKPLAGAKPVRIRGAGIDVNELLDAIAEPSHERLYAQVRNMIHEVTDLGETLPISVATD